MPEMQKATALIVPVFPRLDAPAFEKAALIIEFIDLSFEGALGKPGKKRLGGERDFSGSCHGVRSAIPFSEIRR
jgi:hypothetical protein